MNEALAAEGQAGAVFVEHRSFKDRGGTQRPQKHLGPGKTNALRRTIRQQRDAWLAQHVQALAARHAKERAALADRQHRALQHKLGELAAREQRALAGLVEARRQQAMPEKTGAMQRLANLFSRSAAPTVEPPSALARERQVEVQAAAVRTAGQAERAAYVEGQAYERQTLADRQAADGRQLTAATSHRLVNDRLTERQARHDHAHNRTERHRGNEGENSPAIDRRSTI